ncbi:MAG: O-antigen ligase family protein [Roseofilum sp. SBFL]|uniref:O-antigen ligase family protein n=1 Tax=unclassified Roseofilum TaxID=2620099 RepID=UPI001B03B73A|nr:MULTISPECIES: O-antigen ligase family protein [unclassified Roseofilum]MBP0014257.1 O-antigen ligase family protein [Roseofilum sp. SID3]MBP0023754.1 O-antigen ligase family protein [Roseofilum sp. SID2]MBP0038897.1 O-antigen ligase family protein [Roseofilum sp. SID1]MBP0043753.1 O-antigen ligase family protein [Roseofilum sp. SBFL]
MKEVIKSLLANPLIALMVLATGLIYVAVFFHYVNKSKKNSEWFEKLVIGGFIFALTDVSILPFDKLTPKILADRKVGMMTVFLQLAIYGVVLFLSWSRFRSTLRNIGDVFAVLLATAPFLSILCLMIGFSAFWSNDFVHTLKNSLVYLETAIAAVYIGKQYSWPQLYGFMRWVNLAVLLPSIYYANVVPSVGINSKTGAWQGIMKHKNIFAFAMSFTMVMWLIYGIYNPKYRKQSFVIALLSLYAMDGGESGASKVLFVCMMFLTLYLNFVKKLSPKWAFTSIVLFLIVSTSIMIVVVENLEYIVVDTLNKDLTLTGRTLFWPLVIDAINEKPILGYGVGGYWQSWKSTAENPAGNVINPNGWIPPHSHNGFLDIATDLGWLGMTLYIFAFVNTLAKAVSYLSKDKMPEAGIPIIVLTFTLLTNLTETGLLGVNPTWFWFVVTITRLSLDMTKNVQKKNNSY